MTVIRRLTFLRYLPISPTHGQPRHRFRDTVTQQHTKEGCPDITNVAWYGGFTTNTTVLGDWLTTCACFWDRWIRC